MDFLSDLVGDVVSDVVAGKASKGLRRVLGPPGQDRRAVIRDPAPVPAPAPRKELIHRLRRAVV